MFRQSVASRICPATTARDSINGPALSLAPPGTDMDGLGVIGENVPTQAFRGSIRSIGLTRIVGLVLPIYQEEDVMSKNRLWLSLGVLIVVLAVGLLVGRSQAQPEQSRRADPPFLLRIGDLRFNPSLVSDVRIMEHEGFRCLRLGCGGESIYALEFGTDGQAEVLLEWFDAHSTELKPKPVKKK